MIKKTESEKNCQKQEDILFRLDYDFYLDEWGRPYRFLAYPKYEIEVKFWKDSGTKNSSKRN